MEYARQWSVPSDRDPHKQYRVSLTGDGSYKCSCPHWIYRLQKTGEDCKHIVDVKNGVYDALPVQEFYIVIANVREVTLTDDRVMVYVPLLPAGDLDFLATVVYDLAQLGVPWKLIDAYYHLPKSWSHVAVKNHVVNHKRKVYGPWVEGQGHQGFEYYEV